MKYLSLFSGIGAFEKALDRLKINYELIGYCEIDKYASKSYQAIHGVNESMNLGDITKIDEKVLPKDIDLITYGFPCQDISCAGNKKGLFNEDGTQTRSGLFFEALRIIKETKPKVSIAENVKNLTSKKFSEQFKIVLDSLESSGYNNYWKILNSKDFGVPQNRERVFIVSIRKDIDTGCFKFPEGFPLIKKLENIIDKTNKEAFITCPFTEKAVSAAYRGRYVKPGHIKQNLEVSSREYANALTSVKKDSMVAFHNVCRYFTGLERFRLMDFEDADYQKVESVNRKTQLVRQTGNSIVVAVPYYIFKALQDANILEQSEVKEMELKVNEVVIPEQITFNYEELKQELTEKVAHYEALVYTDEQIKEAKSDRANLNKLKKALNDERIRREKEYMQPFNEFKAQINEIISIIDKPVAVIDKQVKEYEDKQKAEKMEAIKEYWNGCDVPEGLALEEIFDNKWLNASTSMKSIQDAIGEAITKFNTDMATLSNLPEFGFEAQQVYISTLDINKALAEGQKMAQIAKAKAEREAEQARLKAEAEAKKQEEEFAKAMNPPVEEVAATKEAVQPARQWIAFQALLTTEDALALKGFFNSRNIEFKAV